MNTKELKADFLLLLAAIIWGGGFVAGKMALTSMQPFAVLAWRFCTSAFLCGCLFHRRIFKTPKKTLLHGLAIGCIQMAALSLQLSGLQYTTSAKQSFLCTAYVAMTPFISWLLLGKRPRLKSILAGLISLAGIGLICLGNTFTISGGDLLSLAFAVLFGIQVVLVGQFADKDTDSIQLSFFQFCSAGGTALVISLFRKEALFSFCQESILGVGYLAVFNTLAAFLLQNIAQKNTSDTTAALIISLESVFGFLFSVLYYQEPLTIRLLAGGALCFAAILINSIPSRKRQAE